MASIAFSARWWRSASRCDRSAPRVALTGSAPAPLAGCGRCGNAPGCARQRPGLKRGRLSISSCGVGLRGCCSRSTRIGVRPGHGGVRRAAAPDTGRRRPSRATPASDASSTPTYASITTTASTTDASPKDAYPQTSSTVPERWRPDEPHLSTHHGGCPGSLVARSSVQRLDITIQMCLDTRESFRAQSLRHTGEEA